MSSTPVSRPQPVPKSRITIPALPRFPPADSTLPNLRDTLSPANPSPLQQLALCDDLAGVGVDENGGVMLSNTPDGTPPGSRSPKKPAEVQDVITNDITPPDSRHILPGPLVIDSSIHHDPGLSHDQQLSSPSQAVQPQAPEDPFVSTPVRCNQIVINPAGVPLPQISAIIQANLAHPRVASMEAPREDRLTQTVTVHNAQGLFPKEAKLFVANLSNLRTNDQLEVSVAAVFEQFGSCTVIIKRDRNHQPMGFIQYQLIENAEVAMTNANGCMIDGRIIRIEWASARQELIISLLSNQPLSEEAVRQVLAGRGPVASVKSTGPPALEGEVSTAWLVEFRYYADCKEAIRLMRDDNTYRVVPAPKHQRQAPYAIAPPRTPQGQLYQDNDTNSVFLGGLPDSVTEEELRDLFAYLGTILTCNIISKPMTTGGMNTFAFMEFKYPEDAASAANTTQYLRGQKIRVERKQYAQRRAARVASALGPVSMQTNSPRTPQYANHGSLFGFGIPSHPSTPYSTGNRGFTLSDYNMTPPTPVFMVPYGQYASPIHTGPRTRQGTPRHDSHQLSQSTHYGNVTPHNPSSFGPGPVNFGSMNVIPEEQESRVFD